MTVSACGIHINMLVPTPTHTYTAKPQHQDDLYVTENCGLWYKVIYIFSISVPCNKYSVIKTSYIMNTQNDPATKLILRYRQCL
jgi:hypothetical protein